MTGNTRNLSNGSSSQEQLVLRLYVTGPSAISQLAIKNLNLVCDQYFKGQFKSEVIDIHKDPMKAVTEGVAVTPMLIRLYPLPKRILVGSLSDLEAVYNSLRT